MTIKIIKKADRAVLHCTRNDGSYTSVNMGAQLPFHDIAHWVVEKKLNIKKGFYGMIEQGYTIEQLSDKEVIKTLGPESMLAEVFARALGSLYTNSCTIEEFIPLVFTEMNNRGEAHLIPQYDEDTVFEMYEEYKAMLEMWRQLPDGGTLTVDF